MLASDILDEAANRIEKYGWYKAVGKEVFFFPKKKDEKEVSLHECAVVAISRINILSSTVEERAKNELAYSIDPKYQRFNPFDTIVAWNDAQPNRSNVIRKLRSVAKKLRAKGE